MCMCMYNDLICLPKSANYTFNKKKYQHVMDMRVQFKCKSRNMWVKQ